MFALLPDEPASFDAVKNENISHKELTEGSHKPIVRKFKKRKIYSSFIDNIWVADLADMQLISKFSKGIPSYYVLLTFSENTHGLLL